MSRLVPFADEDGNIYERPSRVGIWAGGLEQLENPRTRMALAPYNSGDLNAVYRLYGCDASLLYVGITNNPLRRWKQHAADKDWWDSVDHILLMPFGKADTAAYMERQIIRDERPLYNRTHSRRGVRFW